MMQFRPRFNHIATPTNSKLQIKNGLTEKGRETRFLRNVKEQNERFSDLKKNLFKIAVTFDVFIILLNIFIALT